MSPSAARGNGEGSIYPHRGGYAAYTWVTTLSGRRVRKYVYGRNREDVHRRWQVLQGKAAGGPVVVTAPTVAGYLDRWLDETVEPNLAPLTTSTYRSLARLYIAPGIGSVRLDRLRVQDVQLWLNALPSQCQCCAQRKDARRAELGRARCCALGRCCHSAPSPRTVKDVRTVLRSALSSALREELISRNVAALVKVPKQRKRKIVPWSSEEARHFLESARDEGDRFYTAYVLVLALGLRKGEVLGLTWEAVDLGAAELVVDRQLQRVNRELLWRETKTEASDSALPFPGIVTRALQARQMRQDEERRDAGIAWRGKPRGPSLIFTGQYGTPIDPRTLNRAFTARCQAAGVRHMTVHDARRTCATLLVDLDVHPRVIMRVLRHADVAVTMEVYANASSSATRDALRRLGEALD